MKQTRLWGTLLVLGLQILLVGIPPAVQAKPPSPEAAPTPGEGVGVQGRAWQIESVDAPRYFPNLNGRMLAIDASGTLHLAYGGDHLYYAYDDGSGWQFELVDGAHYVGGSAALALSPTGSPSISYYDAGNQELKFARRRCVLGNCWWQTWTADDAWAVGQNSSLAIDSTGSAHISYWDSYAKDLRYAYYDTSSMTWSVQVVQSSGDVGEWSGIALDSSGYPHIAYYDATNGNLRYAYWDGSAWQFETAATTDDRGRYVSLVLDGSDLAHVSYYHATGGILYYGHRLGSSSWDNEDVLVNGDVGSHTSIALDAAGSPHVTCYNASDHSVLFSYRDGAVWTSVVVSSGDASGYTSLALDAAGEPHLVYAGDYGFLKYAYWDGSAWSSEVVDTSVDVGRQPSLALDSADLPAISYYDMTNTALKLARYSCSGATCWWDVQTVDNSGDIGAISSLAFDGQDHPYIAYNGNNALRYAYWDGSTWHLEQVDPAGGFGDVSLALDASGYAHISYQDNAAMDLRYARWDGSAWQFEIVDSAGSVGYDNSLVLDAAGHPHISYSGSAMCYASFDGSAWITETVASVGRSDLALDSAGRPHIAYFDDSFSGYGYARWDGSAWIFENIEVTGQANDISLALDGADRPHVTYPKSNRLQYAYQDGSTWQIEAISQTSPMGYHSSLALDSAGRPYVGFYDQGTADLSFAHACISLDALHIAGPAFLLVDAVGTYTASVEPLNASDPVTYAWDNGTVGPSADYAWSQPGVYTLTVTATNPCGVVLADVFTVVVQEQCEPVAWAQVDGPTEVTAGAPVLYAASYGPPTATTPLAYLWDDGSTGATATYSWTQPGVYTVAVTASNDCGQALDTLTVTVLEGCAPVEWAQAVGPAALMVGQVGEFWGLYGPPEATLPVTFTWDNGTIGAMAYYSWTEAGTHTIYLTAGNACGQAQDDFLVLVVTECLPIQSVGWVAPLTLLAGEEATYEAEPLPEWVTGPITTTWDNGTVGPSAIYSWTVPGTYRVTVTVANSCSEVQDHWTTIVLPCHPLEEVEVVGPLSLTVGATGLYTASFSPPTASTPVRFDWDNGSVGANASYSWPAAGTYTLTVTATNPCGVAVVEDFVVEVVAAGQTYRIFLPLTFK